jgi:endonuclease/exonuclease/phosphatase family metal-dependent hydrolase
MDTRASRLEAGEAYVLELAPTEPGTDPVSAERPLRVLQWNIERGYELPRILDVLQGLDADVLCLQELDIGCRRTGFRNVPRIIAEALRMNCIFFTEFEELQLNPDVRSPQNAAGPNAKHGNAILTRFPIVAHGTQRHSAGLDWEGDEMARYNEPRRGQRGLLWAKIRVPTPAGETLLHVYNGHFEVFCGATMRVHQFVDMLRLADTHRRELDGSARFVAICAGDFNTMAHGIVRFSPKYARDRMRFLLWGETEGEWFARHVIDVRTSPFGREATRGRGSIFAALRRRWFMALCRLKASHVAAIENMHAYFPLADPFDVYHDITLNHPAYHGGVQGKLDWILATRDTLHVSRHELIDRHFKASDHRGLLVEYQLEAQHGPMTQHPAWRNVFRMATKAALLFVVVIVVVFVTRTVQGAFKE